MGLTWEQEKELSEAVARESGEIDTQYTSDVVCPYCGEKHETDSDFSTGTNDYQCAACEREFCFEPDFDVTFCSWTKEEELERKIKHHEELIEHYVARGDEPSAQVLRPWLERDRDKLAKLKEKYGVESPETTG